MSVNLSNLSVLAYANNFTIWHYKATGEDPRAPGYFDKAHDMMQANDIVFTMTDVYKGILIVHERNNTHVVMKEFV